MDIEERVEALEKDKQLHEKAIANHAEILQSMLDGIEMEIEEMEAGMLDELMVYRKYGIPCAVLVGAILMWSVIQYG